MKISNVLILASALGVAACSSNNGEQPAEQEDRLTLQRLQFDDLRDADNDGVINQRDLCLDTPENTKVDNDGCAFWTEVEDISWFPIKFKFDSSMILDETRIELIKAIEILQQNPDVKLVLIGDTSSEGTLEYNAALAERRDKAVKGYITRNGNIDPERIETQTFNQQTPFTAHLKERKRRTIAVFIDKNKEFETQWNIYTTDSESQ